MRKYLQKQINFTPFQLQNVIIEDNHRFKDINAGRRFGKSKLGAYEVTEQLLVPDSRIWIVAPTNSLTEKIWREVYKWFTTTSLAHDVTKNIYTARGGWKLETHTDSVVECKSADDPTALIGEGLDLLVIDEASRVKEIAWKEALRPTLSDRKGRCIKISTPKGKNWFYRDFLKGKDNSDVFKSWEAPSNANPFFPKDEWEQLISEFGEDSATFRQEFLAEFIDDVGAVFRNIKACAVGNLEEPVSGESYVAGIDVAKTTDYTVITMIKKSDNSVVYHDRFNQITYDVQMMRMTEIAKRYNNATIVLDSTGVGDPIYDVLRTSGVPVIPFKFTSQSKDQLIRGLIMALESKSVIYPYISVLIDELEAFEYKMSSLGGMRYSAPDGFHDDCVISLALAVFGNKNLSSGLLDYYKELSNVKPSEQGIKEIFNRSYFARS